MVKKKNKTLESVLFIINELNHQFSQPIVEQTLKECDGDIDKTIDLLERISERDEIARKKTLLESEYEVDDQLRVVSVISELTNLLGHLTVDLDYFKDVIRSEKYDVERCIQRYFDLIGNQCEDECDDSFISGQQSNVYSISPTSYSNDIYDLTCSDIIEEGALLFDHKSGVENSIHSIGKSSPGSTSLSTSSHHISDEANINYDNSLRNFEDSGIIAFRSIANIETERRNLDLSMNLTCEAERLLEISFSNSDKALDNSIQKENSLGRQQVENNDLMVNVGEEQREMYIKIFDELIDRFDLITYWDESYLSVTNTKIAYNCTVVEESNQNLNEGEENDIKNPTDEKDNFKAKENEFFLMITDRAISTALAHLDDEDNDWESYAIETENINIETSAVETSRFPCTDFNTHNTKEQNVNFINYRNKSINRTLIPNGESNEISTNQNNFYQDNDYNSSYDISKKNDMINHELIRTSVTRNQEINQRKLDKSMTLTNKDDFLKVVKNVFGNHKCQHSDRLILRTLKEYNNDIESTVDSLISKQSSDTIDSILSNDKQKTQYNSINKNNRYISTDLSFAKMLSSDSDFETKKISLSDDEFYSGGKIVKYSEFSNNFFGEDSCDKSSLKCSANSSNNNLIDLIYDDNYMMSSNSHSSHNLFHDNNYINNNNNDNNNSISINSPNKNNYNLYSSYDNNDDIYNYDHNNEFDNKTDEILKKDYNAALNAHNHLNNTNIKLENLKINIKNGDENNRKNGIKISNEKSKTLQWRLVASKEGIKMRQSLLKESAQKNLPQMSRAQGVICKQKLLIYGNMAAKCALEERNPNLNISMSESGKIEFMGFTQNVDFHGNQNIQTLKNIRNGDNDLELSQFSRKMMIDTFDLHGLMIREALQFITSIFQYYGTIDRRILRFIVGRGNHSIGGISRLGPALKKYFRERNISHTDYDGEIRARINP